MAFSPIASTRWRVEPRRVGQAMLRFGRVRGRFLTLGRSACAAMIRRLVFGGAASTPVPVGSISTLSSLIARAPQMPLREEFENVGNWLFRWRSYLPMALALVLVLGLRENRLQHFMPSLRWTLGCFARLAVRPGSSHCHGRLHAQGNQRSQHAQSTGRRIEHVRHLFHGSSSALPGQLFDVVGRGHVLPIVVAGGHRLPAVLAVLRTDHVRRGGVSAAQVRRDLCKVGFANAGLYSQLQKLAQTESSLLHAKRAEARILRPAGHDRGLWTDGDERTPGGRRTAWVSIPPGSGSASSACCSTSSCARFARRPACSKSKGARFARNFGPRKSQQLACVSGAQGPTLRATLVYCGVHPRLLKHAWPRLLAGFFSQERSPLAAGPWTPSPRLRILL